MNSKNSNWKWIRSGDVIDIRDGTHDTPKKAEQGVPLITSKNLSNGFIEFDGAYLISIADHQAIKKRSGVSRGDILMPMIGTIGNPVIVDTDADFSIKNVALFRQESSPYDSRFLFHLLKSSIVERQLDKEQRGGTQKFVSLGKLRNLDLPLPPLPEQKRIAAILDKADAIRRKREKAIELTDSFLRSVFLEMFGDPLKNPHDFETKKIEDICDLVRGSSPRPKGDSRYYGGPIPRLMVEDLSRDGRYVYPRIDTLTVEGAKKSRPVKAGTIVMVVSGDVGRNAILQVDACIHDGFVAFNNLSQRVSPEYFSFFLQAIKQTHDKRKAGAIWQNLTTSQIKDINVQLPPISLQSRFAAIVHSTQRLGLKIRNSSEKMAHLLESIQANVFMNHTTVSSSEVQEVAYAL